MPAVTRWLPASGLLAAVALALTGLISPPPPLAGAPAAEIAAYYARHQTGLEIESVADGIGAMLLNQNKHFRLAEVFAIQGVILTVGLVQDFLIGALTRALLPYSNIGQERR